MRRHGAEWVALIAEGLTLTTSAHGGFFYVIVGTHGLHALGALLGMGWLLRRLDVPVVVVGPYAGTSIGMSTRQSETRAPWVYRGTSTVASTTRV